MQDYRKIPIKKEDIIPTAHRMRKEGVILSMIHGYLDGENIPHISYEYQIRDVIESYTVIGEWKVPSISEIYDDAAAWPERELNELFGFEFEGLDTSERLFLPDSMLSGQGHIIVTPMDELIENRYKKEGFEQ
jgi:NADH:ubiquinone oxidoreductase subunit C